MLFVEIDRVETERGEIAICQTDERWSDLPWGRTYVAVVIGSHRYEGQPVAFVASVHDPRDSKFEVADGSNSDWSASIRSSARSAVFQSSAGSQSDLNRPR